MLNREILLQAFDRLNALLEARDVTGELCVYGGSAMLLAFNARLSTQDLGAVFKPVQEIREAARVVSEELDLPPTWLNDGVKGFLSDHEDLTHEGLPEYSHLRLYRPSTEYLFAMKCLASRSVGYDTAGDVRDIRLLLGNLSIQTAEQAFEVIERFYSRSRLLPKTEFMIHELLGEKESS